MSAAIFGLVGVVVGGLIAASATYFMERRTGWTEARAAALLLYADLEHSLAHLERDRADYAGLAKVVEQAWPEHRAALLFRAGTFPSGLTADEWIKLDGVMTSLEFAVRGTDPDDALRHGRAAVRILEVFRPDRPAVIQSLLRLLRPRKTTAAL